MSWRERLKEGHAAFDLPLFKLGQTVEIIEGPWQGITCKIERVWSTKARIILDGFGIAVVDLDKLEAA